MTSFSVSAIFRISGSELQPQWSKQFWVILYYSIMLHCVDLAFSILSLSVCSFEIYWNIYSCVSAKLAIFRHTNWFYAAGLYKATAAAMGSFLWGWYYCTVQPCTFGVIVFVGLTTKQSGTIVCINPVVRNHAGIILPVVLYWLFYGIASFCAFLPHKLYVIIYIICFCMLLHFKLKLWCCRIYHIIFFSIS